MVPGERQTDARILIRDNALYFPYVNVPYDAWFARVLLYWDKVGSIVPEGYGRLPDELDPAMRELLAVGLVERVVPMAYAREIEGLSEGFLAYVRRRLEVLERRSGPRVSAYRSERTLLHLEKMGSISDDLVGLGVARAATYPWFEVETWAANAFMFFLTSMLGALREVSAVPVTNEGGARALSRAPGHRGASQRRAAAARDTILGALLPAPARPPDVRELLRFKDSHGDLLRNFRREVETKSIDVANIRDPIQRARRVHLLNQGFEDKIDQISRAMRRRWTDLSFRKLLPVLPPVIGIVSFAAGQPEVGSVATGVSLLLAVENALRKGPDFESLSGHPLAYVAHARHSASGIVGASNNSTAFPEGKTF